MYNHVWDLHKVAALDAGLDQLLIGLHLIHEVTSPQAFAMLEEAGAKLMFPKRIFATIDHIVPTDENKRPFSDHQAELMAQALEKNTKKHHLPFFSRATQKQGIVHVIGPELGLTQPGMTIACGDSHTSTHGAFGSLAFGIGTTQVRYVLETQSLPLKSFKVRQINFTGQKQPGVFAKDLILALMAKLGVHGGLGFAYEYAGSLVEQMSMDERMTLCNMSIEGGARIGYVNPDETTFSYLEGREFTPKGEAFERAKHYWRSIATKAHASFDDVVTIKGEDIEPMLTWGITPGQAAGISDTLPDLDTLSESDKKTAELAYQHMGFKPGELVRGKKIDVGFIGSCTNGRLSDLREAAKVLKGKQVAKHVKLLVVPGSQQVQEQAIKEGLADIFLSAGAQWRHAGCSMCLGMNTDQLKGRELCASSSNRNFIGRQGSKLGRTLLMSPAMVAAACVKGAVADVREML